MESVTVSLIALVAVFGGALLGMLLHAKLPDHHLNTDSRSVVTIGVGMVATMAALVLGLLLASSKGFYDTQSTELTQMSANVIILDNVLAHYGPEAKEARTQLREQVAQILDSTWPKSRTKSLLPTSPSTREESLYYAIHELMPKDDAQRALKSEAMSIYHSLRNSRVLMSEQQASSTNYPLLVILVFWLTIIFVSFGLFAPSNATVVTSLFVSALSVSAAILLILELRTPYQGLIRVSSAPLRAAFERLGQ